MPEGSRKPRGGKRRGAGRRAVDGAVGVQRVTVLLTPADRAALRLLGGSAWVRAQLRRGTKS